MLLHLSVFLFFGGLVVFLFNVDHAVFGSVMWWVGIFTIVYGLITVMPILRHNSPYYAPLSRPAWFLYAGMNYVVFEFLASKSHRSGAFESLRRFSDLKDCYHDWMLGGLEKAVKKTVSERSSEMDIRIFDWTMRVLGDDDSLEKFFEAVPGFFSSKLVKHLESDFPEEILDRFWGALKRFMNRTLSSNSVIESVKIRRIIICRDIVSMIPSNLGSRYDALSDFFPQAPVCVERLQAMAQWRTHVLETIFDALGEDGPWEKSLEAVPGIFGSELVNGLKEHLPTEFRIKFSQALSGFLDRTFLSGSVTKSVMSGRLIICLDAAHAALGFDGASKILWDIINRRSPELIQSVEMVQSLIHWNDKNDKQFTPYLQRILAQVVVDGRRDDRWISLVKAEFAVPARVLRSYISHGDSVLLFILIHMTRQAFDTGSWTPLVLSSLSEFGIHDTLPRLQHAFCALWNDILLEARGLGEDNTYVQILREIRRAYIDLHLSTDAAPTFSDATHYFDPVLSQPLSYRYCNIASHRQGLTTLTAYTPSLNVPSLTQPDQSPAVSRLHPSLIGSDYAPDGSIASQQTDEENVTVESPSSADHTPDPSHTHGFTPSLLAANPLHVAQAASGASVPESITWDPDRLVPGEASHDPSRSAPLSAEVTATDFVQSDDPTPQIHTGESGETYHPVTSLLFQHPDLVLATITPSTGPDPGNDPDVLQDATSSATLSHPLEGNQQDAVTSREAPDISENPSTVNPIPPSIPTAYPTTVVAEPLSPPLLLPALSSSMAATGLPLFVESSSIQPDHFPQALRSLSSSQTTAGSHLSPQVTSGIITPNPHDNGHDLGPLIPMTLLPHSNQTAVPAHDIIANTLPLEDQVQHDPDNS
ncbi:hypothetical protein DFH94DRAFT_769111 [Russula ochroleuca]|uniref:Uncharacterized protein n=1 Tax=Russula ochroleuca TaxID=152965 RepID=A0A9P5JY81_9AGAM|nr:hypothetical protein DFH94DRAFT_769111 [Russula ochroleuca]